MQCLACYRDKRGIITHCRLSSNGVEKVFPKDEVKAMLRQKNKIEGLRLTSDPGGGSGERACTVRFRCALYRDHRAGRRARRGAGGRRGDGRGQRGETSRREGDPHGELRPAEGPGELCQNSYKWQCLFWAI